MDGSLRLRPKPRCAGVLYWEQMSGTQTPAVSAQRWDGTPTIAVLGIDSTDLAKAEIRKKPEDHIKIKHLYPKLLSKTTLHSSRERWKKNWKCDHLSKSFLADDLNDCIMQSTHIENYLSNGFLRKIGQL